MKVSPRQLEALQIVAKGRFYPDLVKEDDGWYARWRPLCDVNLVADEVIAGWVDEYVRSAAVTRLTENAEEQLHETLHDAWMMALKSRTGLVKWNERECVKFSKELKCWHTAIEEDLEVRKNIVFSLFTEGEQFSVRCICPMGRKALRALGHVTQIFPPLRSLRRFDRDYLSVDLSRAEAESFLRSGARNLSEEGYTVEGIELKASIASVAELTPENDNSSIVKAKLVVKVAGHAVTADEIRFLLDQKSTLVFFREHWIEVDRNILKEALRVLERTEERQMGANEALAFALGIGAFGHFEIQEVRAHGWLRGLIHQLQTARKDSSGERSETPILSYHDKIPGLKASLRAYQQRGVAWIKFLTDHNFGALLADDMGLGKTIQTIAWILENKTSDIKESFLIIAPLTVLGNWRHEIAKFAPGLKVYTHQGADRQLEKGFARLTVDADVVLTSYNLLVRDYSILRQKEWAGIVLDEAQVIKNPNTQVARAVRALGVRRRLALTGTPIENTVTDVWSIEEFLNPTFLGDRQSFRERFEKPIAKDERSIAGKRLRHALEPFVLRRLKIDSEIAKELGEKREIKEYCPLSPSQRNAYESALDDFRHSSRRSGDVFALLTQLKLICDGAGKLERLCELLTRIFEAGESALIFTQYAKVGRELQAELEKRFARKFSFLHGALDVKARDAEIEKFTSNKEPSAFILSLRAGGFGLNLTKATHVIHFDRWWNPAVENQATDRAHRIGQTKTVFVHLMITEGTLEEHVDEILERKSRVAGSLVTSGEQFLRSLAPRELDKIISLGD